MSNQSGEFDKMPVDEAIKFLDEYSEQVECEKCPVESFDCVEHGCPLVRSVDTIKNGTFVNVTEEELEDIKTDLCDNYCGKRKEWTGDQDDFIEKICVNCPLTRL
jgi:hypothetical protein